jgi:hypothetical protein
MEAPIESGESVSDVVVRMVSEVENCPPEELPPLYETVDPDALNALCAHQPEGGCTISFDFSDSHVVVDRCETVTATRRSE